MSTLDLGKVKQLWRGTWATGNSYLANDIVAYNNAIWICTQGQSAGASTEFSPGKRDRANVIAKTVDSSEIITFNVTVSTVNSVNYFFIDGRQAPSLTLYSGVHYRFYQKDSSNIGNKFALSITSDGIFGASGAELSNSSTAYTYTYAGTAGVDGVLDVVLSSNFVGSLYFYSTTASGYGGNALTPRTALTVSAGWRGYQYWDQLTSGFKFSGAWNQTTQYYYNDIVEYQGATYLSLADNRGSFPAEPMGPTATTSALTATYLANDTQYTTANSGNHNWMLLANGDRRTEHNSVGWFMNKGPIGWPYPHGNQGNGNHFAAMKWITRSGRVYNHGNGVNFNHGTDIDNTSTFCSFPQEVIFNHADWWMSRDNGGTGRLVTPDGQPPRCIQIEAGFHWAHYLFNNGEVWGNGGNASGYLGTGVTSTFGVPVRVEGLNDVKIIKISAPYGPVNADAHHVLALDDQGYVWTWGSNNAGQLGLGHTTDMYTAQRLPRSYFGNERVVDILTMGPAGTGSSYARTAQNNIFAWGSNGVSQLGTGDTITRQRPVQMSPGSWSPALNKGIVKWQAASTGSNAMFMILDGQGFLWHTGADAYGAGCFAAAATRTTLTKSTAGPAGLVTNFWCVWAGDNSAFVQTFVRNIAGQTFSCGIGSNATSGNNTMGYGTSGVSAATAANVITAATNPLSTTLPTGVATGIVNLRDVYIHVSTSGALRTITWLTDSGKVFSQGYNTYGELGNPAIATGGGTNPNDETGSTFSPVITYAFPGTRPVQLMPGGMSTSDFTSSVDCQHGMFALTDIGQVFAWGMSRSAAIHAGFEGGFVGYNWRTNRQVPTPQPVCISWAR